MSDIVERLEEIVENIPPIILSRKRQDELETISEAVDTITALRAEVERLAETGIDLAAHLAAAISLLERGGKAAKKAAPSDKMFDQMIRDYKRSLNKARTALTQTKDTTDDA